MLHNDVYLILRLMVASTHTYWDDETFREVKVSYSFGFVQDRLKEFDQTNWNYDNNAK